MATYNVHAGHCPQDQGAYGAVGILQESVEDRIVKNAIIAKLESLGHTVYDCTCDENTSQNGCLAAIVAKCNSHNVDLDISIHLNSGRDDYEGDDSTGGTEVYGYDTGTEEIGSKICEAISEKLNIRNRGFKVNHGLYVLRSTHSPAILIECCFVDDRDDANRWNAEACAEVPGSAGYVFHGRADVCNPQADHTDFLRYLLKSVYAYRKGGKRAYPDCGNVFEFRIYGCADGRRGECQYSV